MTETSPGPDGPDARSAGQAQPAGPQPYGQPQPYPQQPYGPPGYGQQPLYGQPTAGDVNVIGTRVGQWLIDAILASIVPVILALILLGGGAGFGAAYAVEYLALFVVGFFEYAYWAHTHNGQTPAMAWLGLRVVKADGSPLTLGDCTIRWLLFLVDSFLLTPLVGLIIMAASQNNQRLGDMAAGTLVVRA